jgi:hypothetical protein
LQDGSSPEAPAESSSFTGSNSNSNIFLASRTSDGTSGIELTFLSSGSSSGGGAVIGEKKKDESHEQQEQQQQEQEQEQEQVKSPSSSSSSSPQSIPGITPLETVQEAAAASLSPDDGQDRRFKTPDILLSILSFVALVVVAAVSSIGFIQYRRNNKSLLLLQDDAKNPLPTAATATIARGVFSNDYYQNHRLEEEEDGYDCEESFVSSSSNSMLQLYNENGFPTIEYYTGNNRHCRRGSGSADDDDDDDDDANNIGCDSDDAVSMTSEISMTSALEHQEKKKLTTSNKSTGTIRPSPVCSRAKVLQQAVCLSATSLLPPLLPTVAATTRSTPSTRVATTAEHTDDNDENADDDADVSTTTRWHDAQEHTPNEISKSSLSPPSSPSSSSYSAVGAVASAVQGRLQDLTSALPWSISTSTSTTTSISSSSSSSSSKPEPDESVDCSSSSTCSRLQEESIYRDAASYFSVAATAAADLPV